VHEEIYRGVGKTDPLMGWNNQTYGSGPIKPHVKIDFWLRPIASCTHQFLPEI